MSSEKISTTIRFSPETYALLQRCKKVDERPASYIVDREVMKNLGARKDLQEEHAEKK